MGGVSVTISLRKDEREEMQKRMEHSKITIHEIIKFALRRYLFPDEEFVPLNGRVAEPYPPYEGHMRERDTGITVYESPAAVKEHLEQERVRRKELINKDILKTEPEKRSILKKISEKDKKDLKRLGVSIE